MLFRSEFRPRFGLMRGREFIMKDLYTFHSTNEDLDLWYEKVRVAYRNTLDRLQLHYRPVTANSGQIGGSSSEEFMVLCDIGEDTIAYSDTGSFATNVEVVDLKEGDPSPDGVGTIKLAKGIEAGHVFKLGTKYSEPMNAMFIDKDQVKKPIIMGCYGMGISRLLMAIIEQNNQGTKIVWPKSTAPFMVHVIPLEKEGTESYQKAYDLYQQLLKDKVEVLFDNRDERAGVKFGDADLIGSPYRIIVSKKAVGGIVEVKELATDLVTEVTISEINASLFRL